MLRLAPAFVQLLTTCSHSSSSALSYKHNLQARSSASRRSVLLSSKMRKPNPLSLSAADHGWSALGASLAHPYLASRGAQEADQLLSMQRPNLMICLRHAPERFRNPESWWRRALVGPLDPRALPTPTLLQKQRRNLKVLPINLQSNPCVL